VNSAPPALATRVYEALLLLYPAQFRLEFGDEMIADFDAATHDAWEVRGWAGVLTLWVLVAADFAITVVQQWLRTGLPAVVVLSVTWTTMMCTLIAQQFVPRAPMVALLPPRTADDEAKIMLIAIAVLIWVIAAIIAATGWFWMLVIRRKRRA
jgi:hypothetical protein